jgi:eukaryotic-like serine/threonine-protein kinase
MSLCINPRCPNPQNKDTMLFCTSCGSELLLEGRFRIMEQLGGGGFGKTYEVKDSQANIETESNLKVLKVLTYNHPKYIELFQREAQFLSRLNHPGVPRVEPDAYFIYSPHSNAEPLHCFVMEKIEGLDLKQYITRREACINEKRAIQWLLQLASILKEIHNCNFFHRDIKPSNIMLRAEGQLVLIDFGTAREVTDTYMSKHSEGQVTGLFSAGYSPLEQLNGQAVPQSDFFALGRTFVYLLTGKHPSELYDSYIDDLRWRDRVPNLSPLFMDFLDRLMARLPSQRPQTADEIIQKLVEIHRSLYGTEPTSHLRKSFSQTAQKKNKFPSSELPTTNFTQKNNNTNFVEPKAGVSDFSNPPLKESKNLRADFPLDPDFIARIQQEFAQYIGPMAAIICQRILSKNPNMSAIEFVQALAQKIPDPKQAQAFQKQVFK